MIQRSRGVAAFVAGCALLALIGAQAGLAAAQAPTPQVSGNASGIAGTVSTAAIPDVQIVVSPDPISRQWVVAAVYPKTVDRDKALGRTRTLLSLSGWQGSRLSFENSAVERAALPGKASPSPVMSSVSFDTPANVVDWQGGTMDLEPIIRAYRDLNRLQILYMLPAGFTFRGLQHYADTNVDVSLAGGQGAYLYVVLVKNHDTGALHLPKTQALADAGSEGSQPAFSPWRGYAAVLVVLLALVAALAAFFGVQRWNRAGSE